MITNWQRFLSSFLLVIVNLAIAVVAVWETYHPTRLYGPPPAGPEYSALALLVYPATNLAALAVARTRPSSRFVSGVYYVNCALIALAVVFGVSSCVELTFSPLEEAATVLFLTPPLLTALGLRAFRFRVV